MSFFGWGAWGPERPKSRSGAWEGDSGREGERQGKAGGSFGPFRDSCVDLARQKYI